MNILHKPLPRRTFLRGLGRRDGAAAARLDGAAVLDRRARRAPSAGAPGLHLHAERDGRRAATRARRRSCGRRRPPATNFEFSPTMKALEPFRDQLNVFSGLAQFNGRALGDGPGDHARAAATFLTGVHPYRTGGADVKLGISADQIAAKELGKYTQLCVARTGSRSASRSRATAIRATPARTCRCRGVRRPSRCRPKSIRARRSSGCSATARAPIPAERMARLESAEERAGLRHRLAVPPAGPAWRRRQAQAGRIPRFGPRHRAPDSAAPKSQNSQTQLPLMDRPSSIPQDYAEYAQLMMDLMVVAWQSDMTRVASFMLGREGSNRAYPEIGIPTAITPISHHQGDPDKVDKLLKIDEFHVGMFAYLLKKLKETPDGDGTLLDHSLVVFGSSLSESNLHTHDELPIVLAGSANGQVKGNRHLVYPKETPLNNLFLNMFDAADVPHVAGFGDSTGRLTGV